MNVASRTRHVRTAAMAFGVLSLAAASQSMAQSASTLYTWDGTGDIRAWIRSFGAGGTTATLGNTIPGELTISETGATAGGSQAFSDGFNRVRETPAGSSGGLDLTGLSALQFDLGHNGSGPVNVQFFVQASTGSSFVALGPDLSVAPGINTYQVPLAGLTAAQAVYVRTIGINIRDHAAMGNLAWTIQEVRSVGPGLTSRDLITHDAGTPEGGLQGALVNFDGASVLGNSGQNQTGLSWNSSGSGSLQWTDVANGPGAAISWGNGTALNGNTFNNRTTDLSNYNQVTIRMSAGDVVDPNGSVFVQPFFQTNNFGSFQSLTGQNLPTDGQFHDLVFELPVSLTNMNVVDQTGINLGSHTNELIMNVDLIRFNVVPEPASALTIAALAGCVALTRRSRRTT